MLKSGGALGASESSVLQSELLSISFQKRAVGE